MNDQSELFKSISKNESQSIILGIFSIFLYSVVSYLIILYKVNDVFLKLVYCASVFIFPIIVILFKCLSIKNNRISSLGRWLFVVNLLFFVGLIAAMLCGEVVRYLFNFLRFFVLSYVLILGMNVFKDSGLNLFFYENKVDKVGASLLAVSLAVSISCSLYFPFIIENIDFFKEMLASGINAKFLSFSSILLSGMVVFLSVFFRLHKDKIKYEKILLGVVFLSPILLVDVWGNFDIEHYNAYLGPAIAVLHGKVPLVDVFCQYGLSYLIFTLGYLVFPNNYVVASGIVSVLNVVCWVLLLLIMRKMIKNPIYFVVISLSFLFGSVYILVHTPTLIPSNLCMRYFPTILLSYFLLSRLENSSDEVDRVNFFRVDTFNIYALLSVVWNIETLVSLCILYSTYLWMMASSYKVFFKKLTFMILFVFFIYFFISLMYLSAFDEVPHYEMYLKYIYAYINPKIKAGNVFLSVESDIYRKFFFWMVFAVMHLVGFSYLIGYRFVNEKQDVYIKMLLFLNTLAILFLAYFVLQPSLFSMINSGYPSFIMLFSVLVRVGEKTKRLELRCCAKYLLFSLTFFFFFMAIKSCFIIHKNYYKHGDLLYTIIHPRGFTIGRFLYNLTHFCSKKIASPGAGPYLSIEENTCKKNTYHQELSDIIKKWYPDKKEVLLFNRDLIEVLMEHQKVSPILVNPINDSLVSDLQVKTVNWVNSKIHAGDIVVVEKDLNIFPIEYKVLRKMDTLFDFSLLEETPHLKVFSLINKGEGKKSDLWLPLVTKQSHNSFNYIPAFSGVELTTGAPALFDNDKGTVWSVGKDIFNKIDTFWVWIDLGDLYWVDDIKIWRRIDFRKPNYITEKAFNFLSNFNVELSEDNQKWFMVTSEKGFENGSRYYYESKVNHEKARYARLNFWVGNNRDVFISEIEVFGNKVEN